MKLSGVGEFGLIDRITRHVENHPLAVRGIGDDCAHNRIPEGCELLTSTDMLLEGVHFRRDWTNLETLGRKAVAVNVSDVAAMGAKPRFLYLGLALPDDATVEEVDAFMDGFLSEAERYGACLVGGDTCRSLQGWVLSVTVEGTATQGAAIGREGAKAGDLICVSGNLGDSALALKMLMKDRKPPEALAWRHHRPRARVDLGVRLSESRLATAMIDLSDGLAADLGHILERSGGGARIDLQTLPLSEAFREAGGSWDQAVTGGEDYELLFTIPAGRWPEVEALMSEIGPIHRIGEIREGQGIDWLEGGQPGWQPQAAGFNHFGSRG